MAEKEGILILQSEITDANPIDDYFSIRGYPVDIKSSYQEAIEFIDNCAALLVFIDIHYPRKIFLDLIRYINNKDSNFRFIITSTYPDIEGEREAKALGAQVFLRAPFTPHWIKTKTTAIESFEKGELVDWQKATKVRYPIRLKITLPYVILALLFSLAAASIVTQLVLENIEERFKNQLLAAGQIASDLVVTKENELLEILRLISFTTGVASSTMEENAEDLRRIVLPLAVNHQIEAVEILNSQGVTVLSLRHIPGGGLDEYVYTRGSDKFQEFRFVSNVLDLELETINDGLLDKYAGWVNDGDGKIFYVSGPIKLENGDLVGVILIGKSLEVLTKEMLTEINAEALTIYDLEGLPIYSTYTLFNSDPSLQVTDQTVFINQQEKFSLLRPVTAGSLEFVEVLGIWEARNGEDLGIMGVARAENFFVSSSQTSKSLIFTGVALGLITIIFIGVVLANRITRPLQHIMHATKELEKGNFYVTVQKKGNDEISVLAETFNEMVVGLREGSVFRDLFGRSVSPEIRDALRLKLASDDQLFSGQESFVSIMFTDIRGFTTISEKTNPSEVMRWLNDYFGILTPIIIANNGVINKFQGDALLAFFGLFPTPLAHQESAYFAIKAGLLIQSAVEEFNRIRRKNNLPELITGIGINSGLVTAGVLGASERLEYTLIGDAVNTTQRIEDLTRRFSDNAVLISETAYHALGDLKDKFEFKSIGIKYLKGKAEGIEVFHVLKQIED